MAANRCRGPRQDAASSGGGDHRRRPGAPAEELVWLELGPRDARAARESGGYAQIRLGFAGSRLKRMDLRDNLNQTTRIGFKNAERNPNLDPSLFTFTLPPGVDVLDAEQDL